MQEFHLYINCWKITLNRRQSILQTNDWTLKSQSICSYKNILILDDVMLHLNGSRQNCKYWTTENPHPHIQYLQKLDVWVKIVSNGKPRLLTLCCRITTTLTYQIVIFDYSKVWYFATLQNINKRWTKWNLTPLDSSSIREGECILKLTLGFSKREE